MDENGHNSATTLSLSSITSSPSHSALTKHLIPSNEPTASLVRLELTFWWFHSQAKGKRKADDLETDDRHDEGCNSGDGASGSLAFHGPTRAPVNLSHDQPSVKMSALEQIATLMPEIMRRSMIR